MRFRTCALIASTAVALTIPVAVPGQSKNAKSSVRRIFVKALDRFDTPVADLTAGDFDVTEAGLKRDVVTATLVAKTPMRIALMIDTGDPMTPALNHLRAGLLAFADAIGPEYYEKPYVLVPGKKADKGYVLLRETLAETGKIGIAHVVVRTREYLSAVIAKGDALILVLMRYPQELVDIADYEIPSGSAASHRVAKPEMQMARQLIESMATKWKPSDYKDEFRAKLHKAIEKRMKTKGVVTPPDVETEAEEATTNVVDFMDLLKKSLASNKRTPPSAKRAAKTTRAKAAKTKTARKPRRKSA